MGDSTKLSEHSDLAWAAGQAWTFPILTIDPTTSDDYFAHIINNGDEPIEITGGVFSTSVAGLLTIDRVTGTAAGGQTAVKQVNRKSGAETVVENVTCSTDPDITGLTAAGSHEYFDMGIADERYVRDFPVPIRLNQGDQIALLWGESTGIITGSLEWRKLTFPLHN